MTFSSGSLTVFMVFLSRVGESLSSRGRRSKNTGWAHSQSRRSESFTPLMELKHHLLSVYSPSRLPWVEKLLYFPYLHSSPNKSLYKEPLAVLMCGTGAKTGTENLSLLAVPEIVCGNMLHHLFSGHFLQESVKSATK